MVEINLSNKELTKSHICYFYENEREQTEFLADYLKQGVANNELCLVVIDGSTDLLKTDLVKLCPQLKDAMDTSQIQVFDVKKIYLLNGSFSPNYVLKSFRRYIKAATKLGFSGLRTVGDLKWLHEFPAELDAVKIYENSINKLTTQNPNCSALCMYPVTDSVGVISDAAIRSHPSILNKGVLSRSLLYSV